MYLFQSNTILSLKNLIRDKFRKQELNKYFKNNEIIQIIDGGNQILFCKKNIIMNAKIMKKWLKID